MADKKLVASVEQIEARMFIIRGQKVMLSTHLAELYEVDHGYWFEPSNATSGASRKTSCFN